EIRGAGTLLGESQSGHLEAVGYDLYCKMLSMAIKNLREDKEEDLLDTFETEIKINMDAFIPPQYISSESQKLEMYKKIAAIGSKEDYMDMQDELVDRYGDIPQPVMDLLMVAYIKARAHACYVEELSAGEEKIIFKIIPKAPANGNGLMPLLDAFGGRLAYDRALPGFIYKERGKLRMDASEQVVAINEVLAKLKEHLFPES
ncbi:MAG: transcription-repair coupling factor, partial [Lachnospiraceae bacterium]|nr:transcription-repair coupling factor [Lachnospiraceae bacterium]